MELHLSWCCIYLLPLKKELLEFHFLVQPKNEDTENTVDLLCFLWKQESLTVKTHEAGMIGHTADGSEIPNIPNHRLDGASKPVVNNAGNLPTSIGEFAGFLKHQNSINVRKRRSKIQAIDTQQI